MCDQDHFEDDLKEYTAGGAVSRREFGALSLGAGMAFLLPRAADAVAVTESEVKVKTPDGTCDAYFVHPASGAAAGVIMWPDILGLRPAFRQMGKRLAESGYSVLVVNPFYRSKPAPVVPDGAKFSDPAIRSIVMPLAGTQNPTTNVTDATAFVAWLDSQAAVDKRKKIGTMGYCMSGPFTMRAAAALPDRVGAGASFHGGGLVTKEPTSPHLLAPKMKAQFLFAIADNDDKRDPDAKTILKDTFAAAKVPAEIEVYPAAHGWCPPDMEPYNQEQAEKAWSRLLVLFGKALA
jgi:carboxymethylenebutenolidase